MQTFAVTFATHSQNDPEDMPMRSAGDAHTSHRRRNILTGEWVLVSPHRALRPWSGQTQAPDAVQQPSYDPTCCLCPGNQRASAVRNPKYAGTYVFTNDFPALTAAAEEIGNKDPQGLLETQGETGICRVICYSPRHDRSMADMRPSEVEKIIRTWQSEYLSLGQKPHIRHVQIFENRGLMMGCSNPHPHGQIWANQTVPDIPATEGRHQARHLQETGACLLCRYLETEEAERDRIVFGNASYVVLVPFWAIWPFEVMIVPRFHDGSIALLTDTRISHLAEAMIELAVCYDHLFNAPFPFSMGIHQQPTDGDRHPEWHWHMHYFPPLLRSRAIKKHMVGYEMLAMPQRDLTAESAACQLRDVYQERRRQGATPSC
jgi:UDPglucose--hexose-1-phosphate uridylyltransferase